MVLLFTRPFPTRVRYITQAPSTARGRGKAHAAQFVNPVQYSYWGPVTVNASKSNFWWILGHYCTRAQVQKLIKNLRVEKETRSENLNTWWFMEENQEIPDDHDDDNINISTEIIEPDQQGKVNYYYY